MRPGDDTTYNFVFRALLTEEALDRAGRSAPHSDTDETKIAQLLSLNTLDDKLVQKARAMSIVYTAIAAFENSVRELIAKTLLDHVGADWWNQKVSDKIRTVAKQRMEEEAKTRWHAQRGDDPIDYTMLPNLINIIRQNQTLFEPFIHNIEWAASIFEGIERSRNVIMHSGTLDQRDIARLGTFLRDWTAQVAT